MNKKYLKYCRGSGAGMAAGIATGIAIGAAMHNIGIGIAIGIAIGAAFEGSNRKKPPQSAGKDDPAG